MNRTKPWLIIISGPNGAGKTTFHDNILEQNPFLQNILFANSDIEFAKLMALPENQTIVQEIQYQIKQTSEDIRKRLLKKFRKTMENVGGDVNERIERKNEENKEYWQEQYSTSVHIPQEQAYILEGINSEKDLMYRIGGGDIHARINAKQDKNNWYKTYNKILFTIEAQQAVKIRPLQIKLDNMELYLQIDAGKIVLKKIKAAFESGKNFIFETTGSANKIIKMINEAKHLYGYNVCSFHPYVLRPELSIARVQQRVANGGHNVPKDKILYRYTKSLQNLPTVLSNVDIGVVMDNSGKKPYRPIFTVVDGYITNFAPCPEYLQPVHMQITKKMKEKSVKDLLHLQQDIDMAKMNEEQRENFGQIVISTLLGQIR